MVKIRTVIFTDDDNYLGYPIYIKGTMVLCPKCGVGHLFVNVRSNKIECTYQPNCNYKDVIK